MHRGGGPLRSHHAAVILAALLSTAIAGQAGADPHGSSIWAHVDPSSGELYAPPELGGAQQPGPSGASGMPTLEILPGPSAAGGVMVDLRGHFALGLKASVSSDGRVTTQCEPKHEAPGE